MEHLLLGAADLDHGIAWVERITGLRAAIGGSHPGAGTRNALLPLGGKRYLEIIAPDPMQPSYNFHIDVRTLSDPRLVAWAAVAADANAVATTAREAGYQLVGPRDGSRARPDGKMLKWKTLACSTSSASRVSNQFHSSSSGLAIHCIHRRIHRKAVNLIPLR